MADILKSPYASAILQATFISMVSYVVGEVVLSLKDGNGFAVNLDYNALGRLMSWAAVITPVGLLWQQKLDSRFPSTKPKLASGTAATEGDNTSSAEVYDQLNIFIKVVLSETIFSIVANSAFIAYITYIEHGDLTLTKAKVLNEVPGLWTSSIKVWPLVSYISFGFVPPSKRVVFTSLVALFWSVYVNAFVISK
ncbi:hypothetical protein V1508DRAFT_42853 [Lipomyces doorenjongii]|uniref:uncharacterized protein n=1 Tax=Lipomyces doorenjongii TaxID=383834 RepID=UPI0034CF149B